MDISITCRDTSSLLSSNAPPTLVDCREQTEYEIVHLPSAVLLPMSRIESSLPELVGREEEHLVVYCHHGVRSLSVAQWLRSRGFIRTQSMAGGIDQWAKEIEPGMARY